MPKEHLTRFNGIQSTANSLTNFAAPMVSGVLMTFLPIEYIFFVDVITAAIGIATVFFFVTISGEPDSRERKSGVKAYFQEIMEGLRFALSQPWLKTLLIFNVGFNILGSAAVMLPPLQVVRSFGDDVWRLTAIRIAYSVGMVSGGVLISVWGGFKSKTHTMIFAHMLFGTTTVLLVLFQNFGYIWE